MTELRRVLRLRALPSKQASCRVGPQLSAEEQGTNPGIRRFETWVWTLIERLSCDVKELQKVCKGFVTYRMSEDVLKPGAGCPGSGDVSQTWASRSSLDHTQVSKIARPGAPGEARVERRFRGCYETHCDWASKDPAWQSFLNNRGFGPSTDLDCCDA